MPYNPKSMENLAPPWTPETAPKSPGPGRPRGSSILAPMLRKLAEDKNEHGEGARASELAEVAIRRAKYGEDISGILKLMDRTDPDVKESRVTLVGSGKVALE